MNRLAFRRELRRFAQRLANAQSEYHAASGTAREAPSVSSSGDTMRISDGAAPSALRRASPGRSATPAPSPRPEITGEEPGTTDTTTRLLLAATPKGRADTAEQVEDRQVGESPATASRSHRDMALARLARPIAPRPAVDRSRLPVAYSREGCARCGTRGDLGCEHQRAMGDT